MKELIARLRKMQREGWATDNEIAAADALERMGAENDGHKISIECYQAQVDDLTAERDDLGDDLAQAKRYIETLTTERDQLLQSAERVRVYKQRYFEAIAERDALAGEKK